MHRPDRPDRCRTDGLIFSPLVRPRNPPLNHQVLFNDLTRSPFIRTLVALLLAVAATFSPLCCCGTAAVFFGSCNAPAPAEEKKHARSCCCTDDAETTDQQPANPGRPEHTPGMPDCPACPSCQITSSDLSRGPAIQTKAQPTANDDYLPTDFAPRGTPVRIATTSVHMPTGRDPSAYLKANRAALKWHCALTV